MRKALVISILILLPLLSFAREGVGHIIYGKVKDAESGEPLVGVVLSLGEDYLWATSGSDGSFAFDNVQEGKYILKAVCLGYVDTTIEVESKGKVEELEIKMSISSLAIEEVVVTAQRPKDGMSTSHIISREALNHLQMSNMSDMAALLPGGKTVNPDLTASKVLSLRSGGSSEGNAAFGTALEVDGVRLGNNAGLSEMGGIDTRNLSVAIVR